MSGLKQILVVDDHFEMLELLRSTLEVAGAAGAEYQVLGVPSAEEGFLELQRTPFDLLITDFRLPGMNGLELVARVKRYRPDLPVILITGYAPDRWEEEAQALEIFRYFRKPLDTYGLLEAVQSALQAETTSPPPKGTGALEVGREGTPRKAPPPYAARLNALRVDTGARQVLLARRDGTQLYANGEPVGAETRPILATLATNMAHSFVLADRLGNPQPLTIHYQAGQHVDLYAANIGHDYFLVLLFDAQSRRGRIGTVWIFAQRAIGDLVTMLPRSAAPPPEPVQDSPAPQAESESAATAAGPPPAPETLPPEEDDDEPLPELTWDDGTTADLDAFWEDAIAEVEGARGSGMSLEEARRQGLLPPEFGQENGEDSPD